MDLVTEAMAVETVTLFWNIYRARDTREEVGEGLLMISIPRQIGRKSHIDSMKQQRKKAKRTKCHKCQRNRNVPEGSFLPQRTLSEIGSEKDTLGNLNQSGSTEP